MGNNLLDEVRDALADGKTSPALEERLRGMRAADLADLVEQLDPSEREILFRSLPDEEASALLRELEETVAAQILETLPAEQASRLLSRIPSDDAADMLLDLPDQTADALLAGMEQEEAQAVRQLMEYPETTAGGRMTTEFTTVAAEATVSQVMADLRAHPPAPKTGYYLYVCDSSGRLEGVVSLRDLIVAAPDARIGDIMARNVVSVRADADQEEAANLVAHYDLLALPVVDAEGRLVGVITVDDVLEVMEEEATEDILGLSSGVESPPANGGPSIQTRLLRAGGIFLAGLVAAGLLSVGQSLFSVPAPFLLFLPLTLAVSEVVTTQVMAGVAGAFRHNWPGTAWGRTIGRELLIMTALAGGFGLVIAALLGSWGGLGAAGMRLGVAIFLVALMAALVGVAVPTLSHLYRRDPTAISVSFATVLSVLIGLAVYLRVASGTP